MKNKSLTLLLTLTSLAWLQLPTAMAGDVVISGAGTATGNNAIVVGGARNNAGGGSSVIVGGSDNEAPGTRAAIFAGKNGAANSTNDQILGGVNNTLDGGNGLAFGVHTQIDFKGNVVFTDSSGEDRNVGTEIGPGTRDQFTGIFSGGFYFFVDDENLENGLFVIPSDYPANYDGTGNGNLVGTDALGGQDGPAFVGINTGVPDAAGGPDIGDQRLRFPLQVEFGLDPNTLIKGDGGIIQIGNSAFGNAQDKIVNFGDTAFATGEQRGFVHVGEHKGVNATLALIGEQLYINGVSSNSSTKVFNNYPTPIAGIHPTASAGFYTAGDAQDGGLIFQVSRTDNVTRPSILSIERRGVGVSGEFDTKISGGGNLDIEDGGDLNMIGGILSCEDLTGSGQVEITSTASRVRIRAQNGCQITSANGGVFGPIAASAFNVNSDRSRKKDFKAVDRKDILEKLAALPITTWNWKSEDPYRHIGPMAQDWAATFGYGVGDKHISLSDQQGVALVAIQELNKKLQDEVKAKDQKIAEMEARLERIEKLLK